MAIPNRRRSTTTIVLGILLIFFLLPLATLTDVAAVSPSVTATIPLGKAPMSWLGSEGLTVAVNPTTNRIYVTDTSNNDLAVVDGNTNAVLTTIALTSPFSVAVNPVTNLVYVAMSGGIAVIDGSTNAILTTIPISSGNLAVDSITNLIYAISGDGIAVVSGSTNSLVTTITPKYNAMDSCAILSTPAIDVTTDMIYVTANASCEYGNFILTINGATNTIVNLMNFTTGLPFAVNHPGPISVNPNTDRIYVTNIMGGASMVLDGSTNTVIATPSIGGWGVAVNPTSGRIYFTSGGGDSVLIMDPSTNTLSQTVPVGTTPLAIAANPSTDVVYAYNFWDDSLSVIQDIVPTATLTINTQDTSGQAIAGYYTVLYDQHGALVGTGFSPSSFTVNAGQTYTVQVDNYGSCTFEHWADTGSTNPQRAVTILTNTQLTAIYGCTTPTLSVSATTLGGTPLSGYDITLSLSDGTFVQSCFSSCSFTVDNGQDYTVTAANYGSETFNHWSDGLGTVYPWGGEHYIGVPNSAISTTISLTAVYAP